MLQVQYKEEDPVNSPSKRTEPDPLVRKVRGEEGEEQQEVVACIGGENGNEA